MLRSSGAQYLYILELNNDCFYVGHTENLAVRLWEHFMSPNVGAASWTSLHRPRQVIHCIQIQGSRREFDQNERLYTLMLAKLKGFEKVRGGPFCAVNPKHISTWKQNLAGVEPVNPERFSPIPALELSSLLEEGRLQNIAQRRDVLRKRLTFLDVQQVDKERIKQLGARWHRGERRWFIPNGVDHDLFKPWLPEEP